MLLKDKNGYHIPYPTNQFTKSINAESFCCPKSWFFNMFVLFFFLSCPLFVFSDYSLKTKLFQIPIVHSRCLSLLFQYDQGLYSNSKSDSKILSPQTAHIGVDYGSNKKYIKNFGFELSSRIVKKYSRCLTLLYQYDSGQVEDNKEVNGKFPTAALTLDLALEIVDNLKQVYSIFSPKKQFFNFYAPL